MMRYIAYDSAGRITANASLATDLGANEARISVENPSAGVGLSHYVANGQLVSKGEPPTEHHQFNYTTKQWEDPRTAATEWVQVRSKRDALLSETDWVVTKAVEIGSPVPANWKTYRQALRDVTKQADPFALVWPSPP